MGGSVSALNQLVGDIRKGRIAPVYFLYGPNEYGIKEVVEALKEAIVSGAMAQFNYDDLSGQDLSWETIIERARTLPMMAPRRLVVAWGVDRLFKKSEAGIEDAERYFEAPCPETALVLIAGAADKRLRIFSALKKGGATIHEYGQPRLSDVPALIRDFATHQGKAIDEEAVQEIANLVGTEVMWLRNEVEKACLYVGERDRVTLADVRTLMADIGAHEIWDLTDALAKKDFVTCMRLLESLFRESTQPVIIFGALARQIRQITQARRLLKARLDARSIAREMKLPPFIADKVVGYARRFGDRELIIIYRRLTETDLRLKLTSQPPRLVLESLVADICLV